MPKRLHSQHDKHRNACYPVNSTPCADHHQARCILAGAPPFRDKSEYLTMERVSTQDYTCPPDMSADAQSLVHRLLLGNAAQRIGQHLYVQQDLSSTGRWHGSA